MALTMSVAERQMRARSMLKTFDPDVILAAASLIQRRIDQLPDDPEQTPERCAPGRTCSPRPRRPQVSEERVAALAALQAFFGPGVTIRQGRPERPAGDDYADIGRPCGSSATAPTADHATASTGAQRAELKATHARYDLLNDVAMRRWAETCAEGAAKYSVDNWKKGFPAEEMIAHIHEHIAAYCAGDASEDHLGHALWNIASLMWFEENKPELFRGMPSRHCAGDGDFGVKRYRRFWEPIVGVDRTDEAPMDNPFSDLPYNPR